MLVKRFQIQSKCIDPVEAKVYMEQSNYNIENGKKICIFFCPNYFFIFNVKLNGEFCINSAVQIYRDDILWEMQHPMREKSVIL